MIAYADEAAQTTVETAPMSAEAQDNQDKVEAKVKTHLGRASARSIYITSKCSSPRLSLVLLRLRRC